MKVPSWSVPTRATRCCVMGVVLAAMTAARATAQTPTPIRVTPRNARESAYLNDLTNPRALAWMAGGAAIERFEGLGLRQAVTELDVPTGTPVTQSKLIDQGYYYKAVFDMLRAHSADIFSATVWGLTDGRSWRSADGAPLVFDDDLQAKPAYYGITDQTLPARQRSAVVFQGDVPLGAGAAVPLGAGAAVPPVAGAGAGDLGAELAAGGVVPGGAGSLFLPHALSSSTSMPAIVPRGRRSFMSTTFLTSGRLNTAGVINHAQFLFKTARAAAGTRPEFVF